MTKLLSTVAGLALLIMPVSAQAADLREAIAQDYEANLEDLFMHFHKNPELSHREFETSKRLAAEIKALGYDVTTGVGGTGVVAVMKNGVIQQLSRIDFHVAENGRD